MRASSGPATDPPWPVVEGAEEEEEDDDDDNQ
jgi:hypothetical protein